MGDCLFLWYIRTGESNCYNHLAVRHACTNVPNAWYSLLDGAPDDERLVRSKHVEQNKEK